MSDEETMIITIETDCGILYQSHTFVGITEHCILDNHGCNHAFNNLISWP